MYFDKKKYEKKKDGLKNTMLQISKVIDFQLLSFFISYTIYSYF